jgi:Domain of unknown function (DUF758)
MGNENHHKRQFSFSLKTQEHHKWIACCTAQELDEWREALDNAKALDPVPVPVSRPVPPLTHTTLYRSILIHLLCSHPLDTRVKKSVAGRAATSKMGEVLLMKMFGEEIHHVFLTMKKIITIHYDKETAARVHKILIRLTIKVLFFIYSYF